MISHTKNKLSWLSFILFCFVSFALNASDPIWRGEAPGLSLPGVPQVESPPMPTQTPNAALAKIQVFDEALFKELSDRTSTLSEQRQELQLNDGQSVSDCQGYLQHRARISENAYNVSVRGAYAVCELIALIPQPESMISAAPEAAGDFAKAIFEKLDLRSFPSSFGPRVNNGATPASLKDLVFKLTPIAVTLDNQEQFFQVKLLLSGNLNENPLPDWVIRVQDQFHDGFYNSTSLLRVDDVGPDVTVLKAHAF
jgi:hypothetical protein